MEKDDEVKGSGNWLQFGDFGYDPRIIRRNNTDPVVKEWQSPYSTFANNPIYYADPTGYDEGVYNEGDTKNPTNHNSNDLCNDICDGDFIDGIETAGSTPIYGKRINPNISKSDNTIVSMNFVKIESHFLTEFEKYMDNIKNLNKLAGSPGSISKTDPLNGRSDFDRYTMTDPFIQHAASAVLTGGSSEIAYLMYGSKAAINGYAQYKYNDGQINMVDMASFTFMSKNTIGAIADATIPNALEWNINFKNGFSIDKPKFKVTTSSKLLDFVVNSAISGGIGLTSEKLNNKMIGNGLGGFPTNSYIIPSIDQHTENGLQSIWKNYFSPTKE